MELGRRKQPTARRPRWCPVHVWPSRCARTSPLRSMGARMMLRGPLPRPLMAFACSTLPKPVNPSCALCQRHDRLNAISTCTTMALKICRGMACQTFGLLITREVARYRERYSWPLLRRSQTGVVSQFGEVTGLSSLPSPRRLEIRPYAVERNDSQTKGGSINRSQQHAAGLDVKFRTGLPGTSPLLSRRGRHLQL